MSEETIYPYEWDPKILRNRVTELETAMEKTKNQLLRLENEIIDMRERVGD